MLRSAGGKSCVLPVHTELPSQIRIKASRSLIDPSRLTVGRDESGPTKRTSMSGWGGPLLFFSYGLDTDGPGGRFVLSQRMQKLVLTRSPIQTTGSLGRFDGVTSVLAYSMTPFDMSHGASRFRRGRPANCPPSHVTQRTHRTNRFKHSTRGGHPSLF
jgi:hypothetical protein